MTDKSNCLPRAHRLAALLATLATALATGVAPVAADTLVAMSMADPSSTGVSSGAVLATTPGRRQLSDDGRYIVLMSGGGILLVPGYTGFREQIFLRDRLTGSVRLVSAAAGTSTQGGNARSDVYAVSSDGRFAAFLSEATDLIAGSSGGTGANVYVWDRDAPPASATRLVSHTPADASERGDGDSGDPTLSADGQYVAYRSNSTNLTAGSPAPASSDQIYLWERGSSASSATRLVSHTATSATVPGDDFSYDPVLSTNGRYVGYSSGATDLIGGGSGGTDNNVYHWDRDAPTLMATRLVSHTPAGPTVRGNDDSYEPSLSADGRYLAFVSFSSNLFAGWAEGSDDNLYLWDREASVSAANRLISHIPGNATLQAFGSYDQHLISPDGRYVTYQSNSDELISGWAGEFAWNVFQWDREAPAATASRLVSHSPAAGNIPAAGFSYEPAMSGDGRYVVYRSDASDLTARGFPPPPPTDIYLWDREAPAASANRLVSHSLDSATEGGNGDSNRPTLSGDGTVVAFGSRANNLVAQDAYFQDVFAADSTTLELELVSALNQGIPWPRMTGESESQTSYVPEATLSADGRYAVYLSSATDLIAGASGPAGQHVYLWDAITRTTRLVTHVQGNPTARANDHAFEPVLSVDGRYVAYLTSASDLISGSSGPLVRNIYVWDRDAAAASATRLVSHTPAAATVRGNWSSGAPAINADGRRIAYTSYATDLIADASGEDWRNIYLWDRDAPAVSANRLVSHSFGAPTVRGDSESLEPRVSRDGQFVAYRSYSSDLIGGAPGAGYNIYLWDEVAPATSANRLVSHTSAGSTVRGNNVSRDPLISANSRYVTFQSRATDLIAGAAGGTDSNIYLWDRSAAAAEATRLVSHLPAMPTVRGNRASYLSDIDASGRYVAYSSDSTDLLQGATGGLEQNVYLWDRESAPLGANRLVSHTPAGETVRADTHSFGGVISQDVRYVAFVSEATDLLAEETANTQRKVYRWDSSAPVGNATLLVSHSATSATTSGDGTSERAAISASGAEVTFSSTAADLVGAGDLGDLNNTWDAFWWSAEDVAPALFADGFASGDTSHWSFAVP